MKYFNHYIDTHIEWTSIHTICRPRKQRNANNQLITFHTIQYSINQTKQKKTNTTSFTCHIRYLKMKYVVTICRILSSRLRNTIIRTFVPSLDAMRRLSTSIMCCHCVLTLYARTICSCIVLLCSCLLDIKHYVCLCACTHRLAFGAVHARSRLRPHASHIVRTKQRQQRQQPASSGICCCCRCIAL